MNLILMVKTFHSERVTMEQVEIALYCTCITVSKLQCYDTHLMVLSAALKHGTQKLHLFTR